MRWFDDQITREIYKKEEELWETIDREKIILSTQDEWRFGRIGCVRSCRVPKDERALVVKHDMREYVYMYTAVFPTLWEHVSLIMPYANMECMNIFLKEVWEQYKDYIVVMQIDWARFHIWGEIKAPPNVILIQQPWYSPEINPTEHIREEWREKFFANQLFKSLNDVEDQLVKFCKYLDKNPELIKTMCWFPHIVASKYSSV